MLAWGPQGSNSERLAYLFSPGHLYLQDNIHLHSCCIESVSGFWGFFAISFLNVNIYPDRAVSIPVDSKPDPGAHP